SRCFWVSLSVQVSVQNEPSAITGMPFFKDLEALMASWPQISIFIYTVSLSRHYNSPLALVKRLRREEAMRKRVLTLSPLNFVTKGSSVRLPVIVMVY